MTGSAPPPPVSYSSSSYSSLDSLSGDEASLSPEDLAQLKLLRREQARLREEYERMEAKLKEVEGRLAGGGASPSPSPPPSSSPEGEEAEAPSAADGQLVGACTEMDDGAVLFKFD